jgi:DNA-binding Xre family transcriptional regulator
MTEKIKIALIKRNMGVKDLAQKLDCTSQNLSGKFRRDNFSEKELQKIAAAMNCRFEGRFISNDTGEEI